MKIKYKVKVDKFEIVIDEKSFESKDGFIVLPFSELVKSFELKGILEKVEEIKEAEKPKLKEKKKKHSRKKKEKGDK